MMKQKYLTPLLLVLFTSFFINDVLANTMDVYWAIKRMYQPNQNKHYLELFYLIPGNTLEYKKNSNGKFQSSIIASVEVYNSDELLNQEKYILNSPEYNTSDGVVINLSDLMRLEVPEDSLHVIFKLIDKNDSLFFYSSVVDITISQNPIAFLSDIILINEIREGDPSSNFYRNGKIITPKFFSYYPSEINKLTFYTEFYQPKQKENYVLKHLITDENNVLIEQYASFKKISNKNFEAVLSSFDISKLPSGNYYLYAELRDSKNTIVERKRISFQRNNKIEVEIDNPNELGVIAKNFAKKYDLKSMKYHIEGIIPIADEFEKAAIQGLLKSDDLAQLQNYFYAFWTKRDKTNPESSWMIYAESVQFADKDFGTSTERGALSERGMIYLKYGKPVERVERPNSEIGQYEVWYYEFVEDRSTVYFVFMNTNRITEEFFLVHSNLNNEQFSRFWDLKIKEGNY